MKSQNPSLFSGWLVCAWRRFGGLAFLCISLLMFSGCGGGSSDAATSNGDPDASPTVAG